MSGAPDGQFDDVLLAMAQRSGSLPALLQSFFSFLHRRTDMYVVDDSPKARMGFKTGVAEQLLLRSFRQFPYKRAGGAPSGGSGGPGPSPQPTRSRDAKPRAQSKPAAAPTPRGNATAGTGESGGTPSGGAPAATPPPAPAAGAAAAASEGAGAGAGAGASGTDADAGAGAAASASGGALSGDFGGRVRYTEEGKQIPVGNGGVGPGYTWTQSLEEMTVYCSVPAGTKGKQIVCEVKNDRMRLGLKGQTPVIEGEFPLKMKGSETMWTIDNGTIVLTLVKAVHTWYKCVVKGHPEIDATRVDSTRRVSDYDDETQAAIRKIMFDQRRKAMGLPTSEEMELQAKVQAARNAPGSPFA